MPPKCGWTTGVSYCGCRRSCAPQQTNETTRNSCDPPSRDSHPTRRARACRSLGDRHTVMVAHRILCGSSRWAVRAVTDQGRRAVLAGPPNQTLGETIQWTVAHSAPSRSNTHRPCYVGRSLRAPLPSPSAVHSSIRIRKRRSKPRPGKGGESEAIERNRAKHTTRSPVQGDPSLPLLLAPGSQSSSN